MNREKILYIQVAGEDQWHVHMTAQLSDNFWGKQAKLSTS